jgi:hypothetical protein
MGAATVQMPTFRSGLVAAPIMALCFEPHGSNYYSCEKKSRTVVST